MQLEAVGKNVEIAIQNGLLECGLKREDVEVKVLDEGGLFKKAKVLLTWGENKEESKVEETVESVVEDEPVNEDLVETPSVEETKSQPKKLYDTTRLEKAGVEFLSGLIKLVDENATVEAVAGENEVNFVIKGEKVGKLIGFHGDTMKALQMLLYGIKRGHEGAIKLYIDINGYKEDRNQAIIDLANKTADQAVKIERNIHLDPMNPYERMVVHTTLQPREDVTTESTGEGEKRHVVIKPTFKK